MFVFIDTNVLLHYKALENFDWNEIFGEAHRVTVLYAPIVVKELDKHKWDARLSSRAKAMLKKIEGLDQNSDSSTPLKHEIISKRPAPITFAQNELDKDSADDNLIAAILEFTQTNDTSNVCLVTSDLSLRIIARQFQIKCFDAPGKYALTVDDEQGKKIKELQSKLDKYEKGQPKLNLSFSTDTNFLSIKVKKFELERFIAEEIEKLKIQHPYYRMGDNPSIIFRSAFYRISPKSIKDYNDDLDKFYLEYSEFLNENESYFERNQYTFPVQFNLTNSGSKPAEKVDIEMHFPDGFKLLSEKLTLKDSYPSPPTEPGQWALFPTASRILMSPQIQFPQQILPGSPEIIKTNSYVLKFEGIDLKHNQIFQTDEVFLVYNAFDEIKNFQIEYKMFANNVPDVIEGKFNVTFDLSRSSS